MPVRFACPVCNTVMRMPSSKVGKKGNCPKCGQRLEIPQPPPQGTILASPLPSDPAIRAAVPPLPAPPPVQPPPARAAFVDSEDVEVMPEAMPIRVRRDEPPGFRCPFCHTAAMPLVKKKMSTTGWVVFVVLLICCFPLCLLGLLIKEDYRQCSQCGIKLD